MNASNFHDASPWTQGTTEFWQALENAAHWHQKMQPPYRYSYPALISQHFVLPLPIRALTANPQLAVASLIANQATFEVIDFLTQEMGKIAQECNAQRILGLPTLGMVFAPGVAKYLGHQRWVPMGYSRKFWYDEALSTSVSSITSPSINKKIYLDPHQLSLLKGVRTLIVDDVVSSAQTVKHVWDLMESLGVEVAGVVVAMRQGQQWRETLGAERASLVYGVFDSPKLALQPDGWWPLDT